MSLSRSQPRVHSRWLAGGIHLGLSTTIALLAMGLIFGLWYPGELAGAQGVSQLVLILIGVDVALGPLITTVIYTPGKKYLHFDLMVIATIQTVALLYGLQAIQGGRPAYLVFNLDRFTVVAAQDVDRDSLKRVAAPFALSFWGPKTVAARLPDDPKKRDKILDSSLAGGADLPQLPEYYVPLDAERPTLVKRARPLDELRRINELDPPSWAAFVNDFGRPESALAYLPLRANARDGAVIVDAASGEVLGIRLLTPSFGGAPVKPAAKPATQGVG